jgi:Uma2 family endonuclease
VPTLAVEIISKGNRKGEMTRKLRDYFDAGVKLVWYVEPKNRVVHVYHSPIDVTTLTEADELDGEDVLPGFRLSIREWFDRATRLRPNRK